MRIGLTWATTAAEIDEFLAVLPPIVTRIRATVTRRERGASSFEGLSLDCREWCPDRSSKWRAISGTSAWAPSWSCSRMTLPPAPTWPPGAGCVGKRWSPRMRRVSSCGVNRNQCRNKRNNDDSLPPAGARQVQLRSVEAVAAGHEPPRLGLSMVKPCFSMVSTKSIVAPIRYGALIRSVTTSTPEGLDNVAFEAALVEEQLVAESRAAARLHRAKRKIVATFTFQERLDLGCRLVGQDDAAGAATGVSKVCSVAVMVAILGGLADPTKLGTVCRVTNSRIWPPAGRASSSALTSPCGSSCCDSRTGYAASIPMVRISRDPMTPHRQ